MSVLSKFPSGNRYRCSVLASRIGMVLALAGWWMAPDAAMATSIEVIVDRADGGLFLKNPTLVAEPIDGYQITSSSMALDAAAWTPVTGNYDTAGDSSVDGSSAWLVVVTSDSDITEASLTALSGSLDPGEIVALGDVWRTSFAEDLVAVLAAGVTTTPVTVDFRTLTADYDEDLDVDLDDHALFASTFGSTIDLRADGNGDGVVDAIDYTIWRDSEELTLASSASLVAPPIAFASATGSQPLTIPEPTTAALFAVGVGCLVGVRRPGRQA